MVRYIKSTDFLSEARPRFQFLADSGFLGPEEGDNRLSYSSAVLGVDVHYDDRDGRVVTVVRSSQGDRNLLCGLGCLYVTAELGAPQDLQEIARSSKALPGVLKTHTVALKKVLPIVRGPDGPDLLLRCHGR